MEEVTFSLSPERRTLSLNEHLLCYLVIQLSLLPVLFDYHTVLYL